MKSLRITSIGSYGLVDSVLLANDDDTQLGGTSSGVGFSISWQHGPRLEREEEPGVDCDPTGPYTGACVEDVLTACEDRLRFLQAGPFPSEANQVAIDGVVKAIEAQKARRADRAERGVEGLNKA